MRVFGYAPRLFRIAASAVLLVVGFGMQAQAAVILGNLPATNDGSQSILTSSRVKALAFTMGADSYKLDNDLLRLECDVDGETPLVQIRGDVGGNNPGGTVLASFTNPASQGAGTFNYTFTPTSNVILSATTKYWLYVTVSSGGFDFEAADPGVAPSGLATLTGNRFSFNSGTSFSGSSVISSFQINGSLDTPPAVPEPSTMAVFGIGTLVAGVARARRRRKHQA